MEIDTRFPTKLETVLDAPEQFRTSLVENIIPGDFIHLLVHAPAFCSADISSPATVLAITENGWLVASENQDGGISVEKADFNETLFVELSSILIWGRLTIHFATVGTSYSATVQFDTVEAEYYREAVELVLDGIGRGSTAVGDEDRDAVMISRNWAPDLRADANRYRPKGQPLLAAIQWPALVAGFQRELCPAGALLVTSRELVLITHENGAPHLSGRTITYFPRAHLADFHVGHHDRFGFLALQAHAEHGGEKLEIMFPSAFEQPVSNAMQHVLLSAIAQV